MKNSNLERAIARATGESRRTIRHYGFSIVPDEPPKPEVVLHLSLECPGCGGAVALSCDNAAWPEFAECSRCDAAYPYAPQELYLAEAPEEELAACA